MTAYASQQVVAWKALELSGRNIPRDEITVATMDRAFAWFQRQVAALRVGTEPTEAIARDILARIRRGEYAQ